MPWCACVLLHLCRDVAWHDLAFYNADLYEGLRQMMLDAKKGEKSREEFMATYCCYFEVCCVCESITIRLFVLVKVRFNMDNNTLCSFKIVQNVKKYFCQLSSVVKGT